MPNVTFLTADAEENLEYESINAENCIASVRKVLVSRLTVSWFLLTGFQYYRKHRDRSGPALAGLINRMVFLTGTTVMGS